MLQPRVRQLSSSMHSTARFLTTAGGSIRCLRCTAKSSRTKIQCGKPALKSSKTQKCGHHGGLSTGPKTAEGRQRIADAQTVHGRETKAARLERSRGSLRLAQLEDAMHVLGMTSAKRTRGRKPNGYTPLRTIDDVCRVLLDIKLHPVGGAVD
jgi:hypothetical protein